MKRWIMIAMGLMACLKSVAFAQTPVGGFENYPPLPSDVEAEVRTLEMSQDSASIRKSQQVEGRELDPASSEQAEAQFNGDYPHLLRQGGGLIQEAWNNSLPRSGVHNYTDCERCVYKVRTREFMTTTIKLPKGEEVVAIDVGDPAHFKVRKQGSRMIALKAMSYGSDTSIVVYGKDNRVYPFYVRSEGYNSDNVPDLLIVIENNGLVEYETNTSEEVPSLSTLAFEEIPEVSEKPNIAAATEAENEESYIKDIPFDPSKMRGFKDYRVSGNLKPSPKLIFRDDHFTYIVFEDWDGVSLPTAYVVEDDIDYLVNTRVMGEMYVIESVSDRLSIKRGNRYLCIEYHGEDSSLLFEDMERREE